MVNQFDKVIGQTAVQNVVIVTTKWDITDPQIGNRRHQQLSEHPTVFGPLTAKGVPIMKYSQRDDPYGIIDMVLHNV